MKWTSTLSISVVNCGSAFSSASTRRRVVVVRPVARELLDRRELDALRPIGDKLLGGQARRLDPATKLVEGLVRDLDVKGPNFGGGFNGHARADLPVS